MIFAQQQNKKRLHVANTAVIVVSTFITTKNRAYIFYISVRFPFRNL